MGMYDIFLIHSSVVQHLGFFHGAMGYLKCLMSSTGGFYLSDRISSLIHLWSVYIFCSFSTLKFIVFMGNSLCAFEKDGNLLLISRVFSKCQLGQGS
jgi:hypothetical protein